MIRTQVQLTEEQSQALREMAAQEHVSMAELIRRALDHWLKMGGQASLDERRRRAIAVSGRFHSGLGDLAERHDYYFAEEDLLEDREGQDE